MPKDIFISHQCQLATGSCFLQDKDFKATVTLNPVPLNPNRDFVFHVNYDGAQFDDVEALGGCLSVTLIL